MWYWSTLRVWRMGFDRSSTLIRVNFNLPLLSMDKWTESVRRGCVVFNPSWRGPVQAVTPAVTSIWHLSTRWTGALWQVSTRQRGRYRRYGPAGRFKWIQPESERLMRQDRTSVVLQIWNTDLAMRGCWVVLSVRRWDRSVRINPW